ncbi:MAG: cyclic nucleotide-binding domain-containing protein [Desulfocapsa sp.]|nr:cyclic nucleotide-binding domain-containing protein [Desulfocapsa sp.]
MVDLIAASLDFLDDGERRVLFSLFTEKQLNARAVLFDYNEPAESVFFLKEGRLAVHKFTGFQEKMQVIALLDPGAVVGEAALLQTHIRKTRVAAIESSSLYCLEREDFFRWQKKSPAMASRLLEYLFSIVTLRLEKTSERLARIL